MKPQGVIRNQGPYVSTWGGTFDPQQIGCYEGWRRYDGNPLVHINFGWISEPCILVHEGKYYLFSGWDSQNKITLMRSDDGLNFERPVLAMFPQVWNPWEEEIGAPSVIVVDGIFHMWYTARSGAYDGGATPSACIVHATSENSIDWLREELPCMKADRLWEKYSVQNPSVIFEDGVFKIWYIGGDYEIGDAVGYGTSADGVKWEKYDGNPIFINEPSRRWEHLSIGSASLLRHGDWYYMAYTAYEHLTHGRICLARSKDGINWERHRNNPIITGGNEGFWDVNYVSKPSMIFEGDQWRMYYTGHRGLERNMGCIIHNGADLGFDEPGDADAKEGLSE